MTSPATDIELLRAFAKHGDEEAFRALCDRYTGLVFGCALRRSGSRELAEEVAQNVFGALGRKAAGLMIERSLGAWLHRAAVLESAALLRSEKRHARRVEALADEREPEVNDVSEDATMPSEVMRLEVAASIDAALDQLSGADREVVLLRFYEERSFDEIGRRVGRSDEACRKRVSRSLERLAGILGRQGIRVSGVVLGGLLAGALTVAPPAALAASVAGSAIAGAAAVSSFGKSLTLVQTMAYSKIGGVATGIAFCLLCGAGGFGYAKVEARKAEVGLALLGGFGGVESGVGGVGVETREAAGSGTVVRRSVGEILAAAAGHFRLSEDDPAAYRRGSALLVGLGVEDVPEALQFLEELGEERLVWEAMVYGVLMRWAESDPAAALEYANRVIDGGPVASRVYGELAFVWARADAGEAFAWFRENAIPGDASPSHVRRRLYEGWVETDATAAVLSLNDLELVEAKEVAEVIGRLAGRESLRGAVLGSIGMIEDLDVRSRAVARAAKEWGRWEPGLASEWLDGLDYLEGEHEMAAVMALGGSWMDRDVPGALDWLWGKAAEGSELREELLEHVEGWAEEEPAAAGEWMAKHGVEELSGEGGR